MDFDSAFTRLLGHEGGYSNHPSDPGGETMWGVTKRVAEQNGYTGSMRDLPQAFAKAVYRKMYWDAVRAEELPPTIRYSTFDAAVNSGPRQAILWLQRSVGATPDGILGPLTLAELRRHDPREVLMRANATRLQFMTELPNWGAFSRGWTRRIADILRNP